MPRGQVIYADDGSDVNTALSTHLVAYLFNYSPGAFNACQASQLEMPMGG